MDIVAVAVDGGGDDGIVHTSIGSAVRKIRII